MLMLAFLLLLSLSVLPVAAAEHTVAPSGAEFFSIQDAVDWASGGDTVFVESGTYLETVILNKKIILMGVDSGGGPPVINAAQAGNGVDIRVDGCTVERFIIQNGSLFTGIRAASSDNTLRKNTVRGFGQGIFLISSQRSTIAANNILENDRVGIVLEASNSNDIENNIVTKNTVGITLDEYSLSNRINRNNFINNQNVISKSATSQWSSQDTFSYTYLGQKEQSRIGNYWSDYRGKDRNGDGIGDTSYTIIIGGNPKAILESNQNIVDAFPLMDPTEYYTGISVVPFPVVSLTSVITGTPGVITPAKTPVVTATISPQQTIAPEIRTGLNLPFGSPVLLLAVILVIVVIAGLFVMRRRKTEGMATPSGGAVLPAPGEPVSPGESTPPVQKTEEPAGDGTPAPVPLARRVQERLKTAITGLTSSTTQVARAGAAATRPFTTKAAAVLKTVVADRSRSPASSTKPLPRTARPESLEPRRSPLHPNRRTISPANSRANIPTLPMLGGAALPGSFPPGASLTGC